MAGIHAAATTAELLNICSDSAQSCCRSCVTMCVITLKWAKKARPQTHDHNSDKSYPIYKTFSLEDSLVNLQLNGY